MEFTAKSVKKSLFIKEGRLTGGKVKNALSGAEYALAPQDEFIVCYKNSSSIF